MVWTPSAMWHGPTCKARGQVKYGYLASCRPVGKACELCVMILNSHQICTLPLETKLLSQVSISSPFPLSDLILSA